MRTFGGINFKGENGGSQGKPCPVKLKSLYPSIKSPRSRGSNTGRLLLLRPVAEFVIAALQVPQVYGPAKNSSIPLPVLILYDPIFPILLDNNCDSLSVGDFWWFPSVPSARQHSGVLGDDR